MNLPVAVAIVVVLVAVAVVTVVAVIDLLQPDQLTVWTDFDRR